MEHTLVFLLLSLYTTAQETEAIRKLYAQAEAKYPIGHFDETLRLIQSGLNSFKGTLRISACRLAALCLVEQDRLNEADEYIDLMLKEDPYYSISLQDPERFAERVYKQKKAKLHSQPLRNRTKRHRKRPYPSY